MISLAEIIGEMKRNVRKPTDRSSKIANTLGLNKGLAKWVPCFWVDLNQGFE